MHMQRRAGAPGDMTHRMGFITSAQLRDSAAALGKTDYGAYLKRIADEP
jgi:hypothetical protein